MSSAIWDDLRNLNVADKSDREPTGDTCHSGLIDGHQEGYPKAIQMDVNFLSTVSKAQMSWTHCANTLCTQIALIERLGSEHFHIYRGCEM